MAYRAGCLRSAAALVAISLCAIASAADYPPRDHQGADVVLAHGDRIWGTQENVGRFVIPAGATVDVHFYFPDVPGSGRLDVYAREIDISGTLNAEGAGYTGGGGQGGGRTFGTNSSLMFKDGRDGLPRYGGYPGSDKWPNAGDGPFGGKPHFDSRTIRSGGYDAPDGNEDVTTDTSVRMGSGGAGGWGGNPVYNYPDLCNIIPRGGSGGTGGGPGGGAIRLIAMESMNVSGSILTMGTVGRPGRKGKLGSVNNHTYPCIAIGADGGDGGEGDAFHEDIGNAGWSAGGGLVLLCATSNLRLTGQMDARSSERRLNSLNPKFGVRAGGSVKVFYSGDVPTSGTLKGGRVYFQNLEENPLTARDILTRRVPALPSSDANDDQRIDAADALLTERGW